MRDPETEPWAPPQAEARLRHTVVAAIESLADQNTTVTEMIREEEAGHCLLIEGMPNPFLHVLLDGKLTLTMLASDGREVPVAQYRQGDLVGVSSFSTHQPSLCTSRATTRVRVLRLRQDAMLRLSREQPQLHDLLQRLIIENLADRYRSSVVLQLRLREANRELLETRDKLVHQEKMALLGQMTAGLAHEVNNPATVILREVEHLRELIHSLIATSPPGLEWETYWDAGLHPTPVSERREIQSALRERFSTLKANTARQLAALPKSLRPRNERSLERANAQYPVFQANYLLETIGLAASHIHHLIESLRSYVRPDQPAPERLSIRQSLENTLLICRHWLQPHPLKVDIDSHLRVVARPGHLSQLWTNLLKNAVEASEPGASLEVSAKSDDDRIRVQVIDHGKGIPDHLREKIFEPYFSTKGGGTESGIGLGLSICRTLVEEMGGEIACDETPGGGTTFTISLPRVA